MGVDQDEFSDVGGSGHIHLAPGSGGRGVTNSAPQAKTVCSDYEELKK